MKAVLEFNLDDPDDEMRYRQCVKARDMAIVLFEITSNLKRNMESKMESWKNDRFQGGSIMLDGTMDKIHRLLEEQNINIDELIN